MPGQMSGSLSLEAYDADGENDPGQDLVKAQYDSGSLIYLREEEWDGNDTASLSPLRQSSAYCLNYSRSLEYNDTATISMEFSLQERWAAVPAPV